MYSQHPHWRDLQGKLPQHNRISENYTPDESYETIGDFEVHIDTYVPKRETDITIIGFHGVGGNGRVLSFLSIPLVKKGYRVLCPDLPGYGLTKCNRTATYEDWIEIGSSLVESELAAGNRVFVMGMSAGGMLAYNVACKNENIQGLLATTILDNRIAEVRKFSAKSNFQAKYGIAILNRMPRFIKNLHIPIRMVTNMKALVNTKAVLDILLRDPLSAGSKVEINFLLTMMNHTPIKEPEEFKTVPAILLHPADDRWTPTHISELFFDRIASKKEKHLLSNAGHFPVEQPGITQLEKRASDFIEKHSKNGTVKDEKSTLFSFVDCIDSGKR